MKPQSVNLLLRLPKPEAQKFSRRHWWIAYACLVGLLLLTSVKTALHRSTLNQQLLQARSAQATLETNMLELSKTLVPPTPTNN